MEAEKISFVEYQCPSCGADLHYREDQFMITCKYCGARVERQLDRVGQDKVNALKQLGIIRKYIEDTNTLCSLEKKRKSAKDRVKTCSENALSEPSLIERCPFIVFLILIPIALFLIFVSKGDVTSMVLLGIITAVSVLVFIVETMKGREKMRIAAEAKARIDEAQKEFVKAGDELEAFEKQFNREIIPENYRDMELLKYLEHVFETQQATTLGEGFKLCDDYLAQKQLEDMKRTQIARVMMISETLRQERASNNVASDGIPLMRRGSFADILIAKKKAEPDKDTGADLMMALARASAKSEPKK